MESMDEYADLIAILDHTLRTKRTSFFQNDLDWEMFLEIDLIYLIEYSWRIFLVMDQHFELSFLQRRQLRVICYIFFLKQHTDIVLIRPYSFAFYALKPHVHLDRNLPQFLANAQYYEQVLLCYIPHTPP